MKTTPKPVNVVVKLMGSQCAKKAIQVSREDQTSRRSVDNVGTVVEKPFNKAAQAKKLAQRKPGSGAALTERRKKSARKLLEGKSVDFREKIGEIPPRPGTEKAIVRTERRQSIERADDSKSQTGELRKKRKSASFIEKSRALRLEREKKEAHSNKHVDISTTDTPTSSIKSDSKASTQNHSLSKTVNANLSPSQTTPPFVALQSDREHAKANEGFCDRLAITFDQPEGLDPEFLIMAGRDMAATLGSNFSLKRYQVQTRSRYRFSYKLTDHANEQLALIQFFARSTRTKTARLELNPKKLDREGLRVVKQVLKALIGPSFTECIAEGNITRLDASCDINFVGPRDLVIFSNRVRSSAVWMRIFDAKGHDRWEVETIAIGARESDYYLQVYDKSVQLWNTRNVMLENLTTRIEARTQPRNPQRKSMKVSELMVLSNPFLPINVAYLPDAGDFKGDLELYFYAVREIGMEAVLNKISSADKAKRAALRNLMTREAPEWWQPEELWQDVLRHLHSTGLFPDRIFQSDS